MTEDETFHFCIMFMFISMMFHVENEVVEVFTLAYLLKNAYFTQCYQVGPGTLSVNSICLLSYIKKVKTITEMLSSFSI